MNPELVTPLILTFNEAANLRSTLEALSWAKQIVIIDSSSVDETLAIAAEFSNVKVRQYVFDNHPNKWNFGLEQIETEWVLTLDADYVCPANLSNEMESLNSAADVFYAKFHYCVFGRVLRASLYPPRAILFRPKQCQYISDGHTQLLDDAKMETSFLTSIVQHDDRKPLTHWFDSQLSCAKLEAEKILAAAPNSLSWKDRIRRRCLFAPGLTFFYCLFVKLLILDGWPGFFYTFQRVFAELVLSLILIEKKLRRKIDRAD